MPTDPLILATLSWFLAVLLMSAAIGKLRHRQEFEGVVANYRLLPRALVRPVALGLPVVELGLAAGLLVPALREPAALTVAALFAILGIAMGINLIRGRREIDCGCFRATFRQHLSWWLVVRNGVLAVMAISLTLPYAARGLGVADLVQALLGAAALQAIYVAISTVFMPRPPTYDENFRASEAHRDSFVIPERRAEA